MFNHVLALWLAAGVAALDVPPAAPAAGEVPELPTATPASASAATVSARSAASRPVTFILMESFSDPRVIAAVRRTPGPQGEDYIAIKRSALEPALIAAAVKAFLGSTTRHGARPTKRVSLYFLAGDRIPKADAADAGWTADIRARLLRAGERELPGGIGRHIAVTLPVAD